MKIKIVLAVIVAVLVPCLKAPGQTSPNITTPSPYPPPASTNAAPPPEPEMPRLQEGRDISFSHLTGPGTTNSTSVPIMEDVPTDVDLNDVELPLAIRSLAVQAHLNVQFDPNLEVGADGHPIPAPHVTEKWKDLTAMQALTALLDNNGWEMVWDPRTKVARVIKKNPAAKPPLVLSVVQLAYGNPTNVLKEVQGMLTAESMIVADLRTHQLIVRTSERELPGVEALIRKLDSPTREVLVEARIVETSKDITSAKGIDWTGTLQAQHISFGNGTTAGTVVNTSSGSTTSGAGSSTVSPGGAPITGSGAGNVSSNLLGTVSTLTTTISGNTQQGGGITANTAHGFSPATAFLNADGVQAVLSFLNTDNDTKTIAFPRTVALDGVPTELAVIQNVPIFQQTQSAPAAGAAQGLATIQPTYSLTVENTILNEVGVKLTVTPRIAGATNVLLDLKPEISQQGATVTETLNGQPNQAPSFSRSRITTQASVPSGFTLVIGGMDQDIVGKAYTKVPFFGDIPGLGMLFRSDSKTHNSQTILIFVTPTIISDSDFAPTPSGFEKRKPQATTGVNEGPWDTGEPYDWTKPKNKVTPAYQP